MKVYFLCTSFLSDSQCSFSAIWRAENAISDHSSSGLFKSMIFDVLVLGLEIIRSKTRIPHLMSCRSMSNDESLIYVLVSWVFHNVHFRHFVVLKMRFLFICHRVLLSQKFWIYLCWDYYYLEIPTLSHCKLRLLD